MKPGFYVELHFLCIDFEEVAAGIQCIPDSEDVWSQKELCNNLSEVIVSHPNAFAFLMKLASKSGNKKFEG